MGEEIKINTLKSLETMKEKKRAISFGNFCKIFKKNLKTYLEIKNCWERAADPGQPKTYLKIMP